MDTKKIKKFRKLVRENKVVLVEKGFKLPTVRSYIYTDRLPSEMHAKKIARILNVPLESIPCTRYVRA